MAKNVSDVVMGMLSDVGSATRAPAKIEPQAQVPAAPRPESSPSPPVAVRDVPAAAAAPAVKAPDQPPPAVAVDAGEAPRTLRLRPEAATRLRSAWLEAKRDDVLLTAQDFASDLVMEALVSRRRRRTPTSA
jgi:hypothetical protein